MPAPMTDLAEMLHSLEVSVRDEAYIFATTTPAAAVRINESEAIILEAEGATVVVPARHAEKYSFESSPLFAWLTLEIHSSLEAVGLTAAFSRALADAGLSCNVLAGYHHDHLLVPYDERQRAVQILLALR